MNFIDELTRLEAECENSVKESAKRLVALHTAAKHIGGQELVQRMLAPLLVAMDWLPRLFAQAGAAERSVATSAAASTVKELALGQVLASFTAVSQALAISQRTEFAEMLAVLGDEALGSLAGFPWKLVKIVKKLVAAYQLPEERLKKYEELVVWANQWSVELKTACCRAQLYSLQHSQFQQRVTAAEAKAMLEQIVRDFEVAVGAKQSELQSDEA